jgi:hypothetical protein
MNDNSVLLRSPSRKRRVGMQEHALHNLAAAAASRCPAHSASCGLTWAGIKSCGSSDRKFIERLIEHESLIKVDPMLAQQRQVLIGECNLRMTFALPPYINFKIRHFRLTDRESAVSFLP